MESLNLIMILIIFVVIYLFICDCILKRKEKFLNQQGFRLLRNGIEDIKSGGYFGQMPPVKEHGEYVPLRAINSVEKTQLKQIVRPILKKINKQVKLRFELVDVESFYQQVEESGNVRLKLDVFAYEKLNHYHRRLLIDMTLDYSVNKIIVNKIALANAKKMKNIDPTKQRDQYFSQKILSVDNQQEAQDIYGYGNSQLGFNKVDFDVNNYDINHKNFTSWVFPQKYLEKINNSLPVWPCRREEFKWDSHGVNITEKGSDNCSGINSTYVKRQYNPKFNPGMRQVNKDGEYDWINHYFSKGDDSFGQ